MLVLTRSVGEAVVVGDGSIVITVLKVVGSQVRIGIAAPPAITVYRQEVHAQRLLERQRQVATPGDV